MVTLKSRSVSALVGSALALGLTVVAPAANAAMVFNLVDQLDGTVKLNYSGFVNLTGITPDGDSANANASSMTPFQSIIRATGRVDIYDTGSTTPALVGGFGTITGVPGTFTPSAATGDAMRFNWANPAEIRVPFGYVSLSTISGSMDFLGSLASLGLIAGTYSFNWGVGGAGRTATLNISAAQVSEPSSLALIGLAILGLAFRGRRKSKA